MCPQYNVLFDKLTVLEHMRFYGRLRGKTNIDIERMAMALLFDLSLTHKASDYSMNLSGIFLPTNKISNNYDANTFCNVSCLEVLPF